MKKVSAAIVLGSMLAASSAQAGLRLIEQVTTCKSVKKPNSCAKPVRTGMLAFEKYVYCDAARGGAFGVELKVWQGIGNLKVTSSLPTNSTWINVEKPWGEFIQKEFICFQE